MKLYAKAFSFDIDFNFNELQFMRCQVWVTGIFVFLMDIKRWEYPSKSIEGMGSIVCWIFNNLLIFVYQTNS